MCLFKGKTVVGLFLKVLFIAYFLFDATSFGSNTNQLVISNKDAGTKKTDLLRNQVKNYNYSVKSYDINDTICIPQAGFLKVDNTTFILDIHDDGRVHVNFDIESKRRFYDRKASGSDTFNLHIKLCIPDATPIPLETEIKTIKCGEKKHFFDDFKLEKSIIEKIEKCEVSINIIGNNSSHVNKRKFPCWFCCC